MADTLKRIAGDLLQRCHKLEAENASLRAALDPFAKFHDVVQFNARLQAPDTAIVCEDRSEKSGAITYGDLRRARAAFANDKAEEAYYEGYRDGRAVGYLEGYASK